MIKNKLLNMMSLNTNLFSTKNLITLSNKLIILVGFL